MASIFAVHSAYVYSRSFDEDPNISLTESNDYKLAEGFDACSGFMLFTFQKIMIFLQWPSGKGSKFIVYSHQ